MKLAEYFNGLREIIEAAETPFSKLAVFVLPIIAPLVPAFMTALHMYQLLLEMFTFSGAKALAGVMSFIVGVVLELLGYVGAIMLIKSVFSLIRRGKDEYLIPAVINLLAYGFYLLIMFMVNVRLGQYFGVAKIVNDIVGMLSFITVPTGLLAANHLSQKESDESDTIIRREKMDYNLKRTALKHGHNIFGSVYQQTAPAPSKEKSDWRNLSKSEREDVVNRLSVNEILKRYPISKATAYEWKKKEV